mmetsp:Transcript_31302/g.62531  ORF Transcript_31302/g.62531 Transcript_31302/m.62531 type:complete len:371 (-) Transcript_31302:49-1161(-)
MGKAAKDIKYLNFPCEWSAEQIKETDAGILQKAVSSESFVLTQEQIDSLTHRPGNGERLKLVKDLGTIYSRAQIGGRWDKFVERSVGGCIKPPTASKKAKPATTSSAPQAPLFQAKERGRSRVRRTCARYDEHTSKDNFLCLSGEKSRTKKEKSKSKIRPLVTVFHESLTEPALTLTPSSLASEKDENLTEPAGGKKPGGKALISGYKGVSWNNRDQKWIARIKIGDKVVYIGQFDDKLAAARGYDKRAAEIGRPTNFDVALVARAPRCTPTAKDKKSRTKIQPLVAAFHESLIEPLRQGGAGLPGVVVPMKTPIKIPMGLQWDYRWDYRYPQSRPSALRLLPFGYKVVLEQSHGVVPGSEPYRQQEGSG